MANRHITYQFDWGFATYDSKTEQEMIDATEAEGLFINKFPVTIAEREIIDQEGATIEVIDGELVVAPPQQDLLIPLSNEAAAAIRGSE